MTDERKIGHETTELTQEELIELLGQLISWNALELCPEPESRLLRIPYVMNDGVESYLELNNCKVQGELDDWLIEKSTLSMVKNECSNGVILRQPSGNIISIWYGACKKIVNCFQYHRIGHAWRKKKGEESIRRLVNLLCVLHDKKHYLGSRYCNETERWLADLAEFPPILNFSPINESILDWYPASLAGITAFIRLAELAGDTALKDALERYQSAFLKGKLKTKQIDRFSKILLEKGQNQLWNCLELEVENASKVWQKRCYGMAAEINLKNEKSRLMQKYEQMGYTGSYPKMVRSDGGKTTVCFVEEQPFSVMEASDFQYRIFSMISHENEMECIWKEETSWKHQLR